ncbi:hypothetical protein [Pseudorhodoferax sp. Leaf267]|uniref:hypothetical protein n=1 Tax=Pseudorhodoferax sp. Leaf267 TaxID=1736316 RepID=UPI0006F3108C|nr:hypothetical protein [Pseudorhodoferax sp. Leaf267]KQP18304.1 hypothetical protein ASF43_10830 [Pseudorhodoferax sp. Leaf267]
MHDISRKTAAALAASTLLALGACGGGGGDDNGGSSGFVEGTDVPVGVEQRITDVIAFARQLIAGTSETTEPAVLGNAKLATDDTADPVDL